MANHPRTFFNRNFAARDEAPAHAHRRGTRTYTSSDWNFQDRPRTQTWTQGPLPRMNHHRTDPQRYATPGHRRDRRSDNGYTRPRMSRRVDTANEQFGLIISLVFEICQLRHHADNWIELPRSINRNIDNLFHNINLPRPNDDLKGQKIVIKNLLKHDLQEAAQSHIQTQLDIALSKIKLIDPTDKDKCKEVVKRKLMHNIARISRVNLDMRIDECINLIGSQYTRASRSYSDAVRHNIDREQNITTNAQRTMTSVAQHNSIDSLDDITLIKRPYKTNKRQLPTSPPIQVSNRFDVLRDLETESPMKARRLTVNEATCISGTTGNTRGIRAAAAAETTTAADAVAATAAATRVTATALAAAATDAKIVATAEATAAAAAAEVAAAADATAAAAQVAAAAEVAAAAAEVAAAADAAAAAAASAAEVAAAAGATADATETAAAAYVTAATEAPAATAAAAATEVVAVAEVAAAAAATAA